MKVEILEERLKDGDRVTGQQYDLHAGDRVTVSDQCGEWWCSQGWARDLDGNVETAERVVRGARIDPDKASHSTQSSEG